MENRREPGENSKMYKGLAVHESNGIVAALSPCLIIMYIVSILVSSHIIKSMKNQSRKNMTRSAYLPGLGVILLRVLGAPPLISALAMVSSCCWYIMLGMMLGLVKMAVMTIKQ